MNGVQNFINITTLEIVNNNLTGNIPSEISNLTHLTKLNGSLPSTIGNLTSLDALYLKSNKFSGEIPSSLGNLTSLNLLTLSNNNFTGRIPDSFVNLIALTLLEINNNPLDIFSLANTDEYIIDNITQTQLNNAIDDLSKIPNGSDVNRATIQAQIDSAQALLDLRTTAETAVGTLLNSNNDGIVDGVIQGDIDNAQLAINDLPSGEVKNALQADLDYAISLFNRKKNIVNEITEELPMVLGVDAVFGSPKEKKVIVVKVSQEKESLERMVLGIGLGGDFKNNKRMNGISGISSESNNMEAGDKGWKPLEYLENNKRVFYSLFLIIVPILGGTIFLLGKRLKKRRIARV